MPSKTTPQANLMARAAHDPAFARKVGVPTAVAKEFNQADKGKGIIGRKKKKKPRRSHARAIYDNTEE